MAFTIKTQKTEKTFSDKELVNICSKDGFDLKLDVEEYSTMGVKYACFFKRPSNCFGLWRLCKSQKFVS